jgi:mannitol-1-phosphate/altronate dehydrogenase
MQIQDIRYTVARVIKETIGMVVNRYGIDHGFASAYGEKELKRFGNELLFDPIKRVAREPLRKLALDERLVGAARLCIQSNITPHGIIEGILSALKYDEQSDPDYEKMQEMNVHMLGLDNDEPLMYMLREEE